ncbi:hypothetical protein AJ79_01058 [Helicocarpus griseus UAMH5409]|uniref:Uncharacterized protein n=1 Tax=Helicocarpus griseus UAMH5409 TaxID=1447875 RepID=A0A2B7Y964_9EURO|nr:hypothetical protein AJ79_01058 [Helicocarpus griseus UAMH5409]
MPPLPGFTNNPFKTYSDLTTASTAILHALTPYTSPSGARIRLPIATGTHFDEAAAQLEGYARPLWAVASLFAAADRQGQDLDPEIAKLLQPWCEGIVAGTDPTHEDYWGNIGEVDQRMVEAEVVAWAILMAPGGFFNCYGERVRGNVVNWLRGMNGKRMPETNWRWFRVLGNLALVRECGVPFEEVREQMEADLELLEEFYVEEGWAADGMWRTVEDEKEDARVWERRVGPEAVVEELQECLEAPSVGRGQQMDYYSGSFAIQFSQLLYVKFAAELYPKRVEVFKQRARDFAKKFWRYFDEDGAAIPFGRSLSYRFSMGAFFSAVALAEVTDLPAPLSHPGTVKGLLLRHLRWWARNSASLFNADGTMSIGYLYPNMYMSEDYNSPQSVYWCLKSLVVLALPATNDFWTCPEFPHPLVTFNEQEIPRSISPIKPPAHILTDHPHAAHHFLLSSAQFCAWPLKASQAKYCKFAYSSAFGFSVPTGPLLQQMAPDSTLALSRDGGASWSVKWKPLGLGREFRIIRVVRGGAAWEQEHLPALIVRWQPWVDGGIEVETTLIPPSNWWLEWHVRVHVVINRSEKPVRLVAVEGGFAISGRREDGTALPPLDAEALQTTPGRPSREHEGTFTSPSDALILSPAGASGIAHLPPIIDSNTSQKPPAHSAGSILKPDANTNLMCQRTLIPTVRHAWIQGPDKVILVSGVFCRSEALRKTRGLALRHAGQEWLERPAVHIGNDGEVWLQ